MVAQPCQQVADRFGIGCLPSQQGGELCLAAGTLKVDDQLPRGGGGRLMPVVIGDERECEVDASGHVR